MALLIIIIGLLTVLVVKWWSNRRCAALISRIPGPYHYPILGVLPYFLFLRGKAWGYLYKFAKSHSLPIYKTLILNSLYVHLMVPEDVRILLSSGKYLNKGKPYKLLEPWIGKGLFISSGMIYRERTKMIAPSFNRSTMSKFVEIFKERSEKLGDLIVGECVKAYTEVELLVSKAVMHAICETTMGTKLNEDSEDVKQYLKAANRSAEIFLHQLGRPWCTFLPLFALTPTYWEQRTMLKVLHDFTRSMIDRKIRNFELGRRESASSISSKNHLGLLDLLIDNSFRGTIDKRDIGNEVDTFMFAGHETTTSMINFALLLLATHKDVQQKVYEEAERIFNRTDQTTYYEELQSLQYLDQVLKETLRLYPSAPLIGRYITEEMTTHTGYTIPKGSNVNVHIFDIHHNPDFYPEPRKFDPERFSPENCKNRQPFTFLAFSGGPRVCMGNKFSLLLGKSILSSILREYELEPVDTDKTIKLVSTIVLKTQKSIKLKFKRR